MKKFLERLSNAMIGFCVGGITGTIYVFIFKDQFFMYYLLMFVGFLIGVTMKTEGKKDE